MRNNNVIQRETTKIKCVTFRLVKLFFKNSFLFSGVIFAIMEKAGAIPSLKSASSGTVAAGYQNFIICLEMLLAAVALRFAFPHGLYAAQSELPALRPYPSANGGVSPAGSGRMVSLQSISSSLKDTMSPRDMMNDAIHNFHPQYQQYTQQVCVVAHSTDEKPEKWY